MATNATEWWSFPAFQVHNLRGVDMPVFRAGDMVEDSELFGHGVRIFGKSLATRSQGAAPAPPETAALNSGDTANT